MHLPRSTELLNAIEARKTNGMTREKKLARILMRVKGLRVHSHYLLHFALF
jgi:hypothetical protein